MIRTLRALVILAALLMPPLARAQQVVNVIGGASSATWMFTGCTVGTSSAQCLAALAGGSFYRHLQVQNTSATANIACNWGGTAVLNSANGSFTLLPGQAGNWGPSTAGAPTAALNCIASAPSTPLYEEYN